MSINISLHAEEILCELKGTYETTYSIPSRNYLQDIGDALKNFTAGPYTPFLVDKAKANISDKWDREDFFVNQYWSKDEICLLYTSPSPRDTLLSRMPSSA